MILQKLRTIKYSKIIFCYTMLLPIFVLFMFLRIIPIAQTFWMSLFDWKLVGSDRPFLGLGNYFRLIFDDQFLLSLNNTFLYAGASVILCLLISLPIAVALNKKMKFIPIPPSAGRQAGKNSFPHTPFSFCPLAFGGGATNQKSGG